MAAAHCSTLCVVTVCDEAPGLFLHLDAIFASFVRDITSKSVQKTRQIQGGSDIHCHCPLWSINPFSSRLFFGYFPTFFDGTCKTENRGIEHGGCGFSGLKAEFRLFVNVCVAAPDFFNDLSAVNLGVTNLSVFQVRMTSMCAQWQPHRHAGAYVVAMESLSGE